MRETGSASRRPAAAPVPAHAPGGRGSVLRWSRQLARWLANCSEPQFARAVLHYDGIGQTPKMADTHHKRPSQPGVLQHLGGETSYFPVGKGSKVTPASPRGTAAACSTRHAFVVPQDYTARLHGVATGNNQVWAHLHCGRRPRLALLVSTPQSTQNELKVRMQTAATHLFVPHLHVTGFTPNATARSLER
jgi:hypothetical protein